MQILSEEIEDKIIDILNSDMCLDVQAEHILEYIAANEWKKYYEDYSYKYDSKLKIIAKKYVDFKNCFALRNDHYYSCTRQEEYRRLNALKEIRIILESDASDEYKLNTILKYFSTIKIFNKSFQSFLKKGSDDARLDEYREELNSFDDISKKVEELLSDKLLRENVDYKNKLISYLEENNYLDNYLYAEWIIKKYIADEDSYLDGYYFKLNNIDKEEFRYSVELIKSLNPTLYKEYLSVRENNETKKYITINQTFKDLEVGIKTGFMPDGFEFNLLEFYKRVPFKTRGIDFFPNCVNYIGKVFGRESSTFKTITAYMYKNDIKTMRWVSIDVLSKSKVTINGVEITRDILEDVFLYLEVNGLPKVYKVYFMIVNKYINKEINMDEAREQKNKLDNFNKNNVVNPYKLVRKVS